jgi:hypothetical protein
MPTAPALTSPVLSTGQEIGDDTAYPTAIESGLLRAAGPHNRAVPQSVSVRLNNFPDDYDFGYPVDGCRRPGPDRMILGRGGTGLAVS